MKTDTLNGTDMAQNAALEVLLHNAKGSSDGLPRTAGWGYPEPYTRDLMFSILGIAASGNLLLLESIRIVLETLAKNQTEHGHIPSLVNKPDDRGASDTTPLFLIGVAIYQRISNNGDFLKDAVEKAMIWMDYQSPSDRCLAAQQPTSDWRDEQWILGYGLYVNTLKYCYLRLFNKHEKADRLRNEMSRFTITQGTIHNHVHEGLVVKHKPYYACWSYKIFSSERFDLLGNCLAILSGIASLSRAEQMIKWIEEECVAMREKGLLADELPPNFFPFVEPKDPDWHRRYSEYNKPGEYHNGGIWPFICGFYVAALVAAKKYTLASHKLNALTKLVTKSASGKTMFGFNEWIKAQNGEPRGQDWQTWSAALYLYAVKCVKENQTPYFDEMRSAIHEKDNKH